MNGFFGKRTAVLSNWRAVLFLWKKTIPFLSFLLEVWYDKLNVTRRRCAWREDKDEWYFRGAFAVFSKCDRAG